MFVAGDEARGAAAQLAPSEFTAKDAKDAKNAKEGKYKLLSFFLASLALFAVQFVQ